MELPGSGGDVDPGDKALGQTGPAADQLKKWRRHTAVQTSQLRRQQQAQSCSIVQRIIQEEWAASQKEEANKIANTKRRHSDQNILSHLKEPLETHTCFNFSGAPNRVGHSVKNAKENERTLWPIKKPGFPPRPVSGGPLQPEETADSATISAAQSTKRPEAVSGNTQPLQRSLSVFEQRAIEQALQEQQRTLLEGTPQRVAGRMHAGPSFRCRPSEVVFNGLDVGGVYVQNVEVTNVSLGFSTFRVLPLPEELEDIISVRFEAPGRMSAGCSTQLTVTFAPKKEEDFKSAILLLSPSGPQSLPIVCYRKRAVLSFHPPVESAQSLQARLEALWAPAGEAYGVAFCSNFAPRLAGVGSSAVREGRGCVLQSVDGMGEKPHTGGVIYLHAEDVQLGEVAAVRLRLRNTGTLSTAYRLFPVTPEKSAGSPTFDPATEQHHQQPTDSAAFLQDQQEDFATDARTVDEVSRRGFPDMFSRAPLDKADSPVEIEEDLTGLSACAWLEALRGEAVVLAQRLRVSSKQNSQAWVKLAANGILELFHKSMERVPRPAAPRQISLERTLVKNAAGNLDAHQTQEISIVYAPTSTGRFVGFFALQFADPEHGDVAVVVEGNCVLPPVRMDAPHHDLGICVPNRVYRQQFQVTSRSTLTRKLQVVSPVAESGVFWVEPASSFIQAQGRASLIANISLSFAFFERNPQFVQPLPAAGVRLYPKSVAFKIPIHIKVSDQVLYAETSITALNFGVSDSTTRCVRLLKVYNPSLLIAYYCFRSSDRALLVLEPPHLSDLRKGVSKQHTSGTAHDIPAPSSNHGVSLTAQGVVNSAAAVADLPPRTGGSSSSLDSINDLSLSPPNPPARGFRPLDGYQSIQSPPPRHERDGDKKAWHLLCEQLPPLDWGGTGVLLPGETRTFAVVLDPRELRSDAHALQLASGRPVEREGVLRMRVLLANQSAYEVKIPWAATVVESPIAVLPAASLKLPPVPVGQSASATLELRLAASYHSLVNGPKAATTRQAKAADPSVKKATQWEALLVEVQQPSQALSALSITPLRLILDAKKRSSSLFFSFAPTDHYMQPLEQQTLRRAEEASRDSSNPPCELYPDVSRAGRDKNTHPEGRGIRDGTPLSGGPNGTLKAKEGPRKGGKSGGSASRDSKARSDKIPTQGDNKAVSTKETKRVAPEVRDIPGEPLEISAESGGDGSVSDGSPAAGNGAAFGKQNDGMRHAESVIGIVQAVADAGGARWTSQKEEGDEDIFVFDSPHAYHHARWLIPLKIYSLTTKQLGALLSSGSTKHSNALAGSSIIHSFIEVTTCATPPLLVTSSTHVKFGSVMTGQRVYQQVVLRCDPRAPPCRHTFKALPFPPGSRFSLVSAAREVAPGRPLCLTVLFHPNAAQTFAAELTLVSARTRISIPLSGEGVQHTIDLVPSQAAYDMGAVVCSPRSRGAPCASSTSVSLTLKNRTSTSLVFSLTRLHNLHPQLECARAGTGLSFFSCEPNQGILPGLGSVVVAVEFRPLHPEGWIKEDFKLKFASDALRPRVLTFFGLATGSLLYASLPPLSSGAITIPHETGRSPHGNSESCITRCCCTCGADRIGQRSAHKTKRKDTTCLACCMQSLSHLVAERGLLEIDEAGSPRNAPVDEANSVPRTKGAAPTHQPSQLPGCSAGPEKRRPEVQQKIDIQFHRPLPDVSSLAPAYGAVGVSVELSNPTQKEMFAAESTQKLSTRTAPPPDGKIEGDSGMQKREADVIVENEHIRTIVIGGAWAPGLQGSPPYSSLKGDAVGNFEVVMDASTHSHLFMLEPAKGTLFSGCRQMIRATFVPQAASPEEKQLLEISRHQLQGALGPQQVTATAKLLLRVTTGSAAPQVQEVVIRLSGLLSSEAT